MIPRLYIVVPCYNEQEVLPITSKLFTDKLQSLILDNKVAKDSRILFVNDGSHDNTWDIISSLAKENEYCCGISLSRNCGHQNALLAGLNEACDKCDITVSIDCDGQDDINAIDKMIEEYLSGAEIVYGVRSDRKSDSFFKRFTAESFYKFMKAMGVETVFNHADYRLISAKALKHLSDYKEQNLYLRGIFPLIGFKSSRVYYERSQRCSGKSHYSLKNMLKLALNGITGFSTKPIDIILTFGAILTALSFIATVVTTVMYAKSVIANTWLIVSVIALFAGIQLFAIGIVGEYVGRSYFESKHRPRYIISERTDGK